MTKLQRRAALMDNATYRKKYMPLPANSPVPVVEIPKGKWDFWELWAGCGRLSSAVSKLGLTVGPPITKEHGWDISLPKHQQYLSELYEQHCPEVVFAAPTCGPWSQSCTTMDSEIKKLIRQEQEEAFSYYHLLCVKQHRASRKFLMEQPRSSELLHVANCLALVTELGGKDELCCMCAHGLVDPDNGQPCMKPTCLRGNVTLRRAVRWCTCTKPHQLLQGRGKNGTLRTSVAQAYTKLFCQRLAADIADDLKSSKRASAYFPAGDEEYGPNPSLGPRVRRKDSESDDDHTRARVDPYQGVPEEELERAADKCEQELKELRSNTTSAIKPYLLPTSKALARPTLANTAQPGTPPIVIKPKVIPTHVPGQAASSNSVAVPREISAPSKGTTSEPIAIDDLPVAPDVEASELQLAKSKPVLTDFNDTLQLLSKQSGLQLPNGGYRSFQTGAKVKVLQELFGTPANKTIKLVILTKKAGALALPEPLCSRQFLTHYLHLSQDTTESNWTNHGWKEIGELLTAPRGFARKPAWSLVIFAAELAPGDLASHLESTPIETIEERRELDAANINSLPVVLRNLTSGDQALQMRTLLALHKRLHHRKASELRTILSRSGLPGRLLALVEDAVNTCTECRKWQVPHVSPSTKVSLASSFNQLIYGDLMFVAEPPMILLILLDDCIRFCIVKHVEYKSFDTLTECLRQGWFALFGPPKRFRCDSESAFAADSFGIYCESIGTQRELVIAGDSHSLLSPLDRKVKILRLAAPRVISTLASDGISISPEDLAAELQYCVNSQLSYGGITPYSCLFGKEPQEFWNDETEELSASDSRLPFWEMAHVRHRSISAFHGALLRYRMERSLKARPRTDHAQSYSVGQLVDVYIKTPKKDQEGWRGPGVILGFIGEGRATIRWQSNVKDLPFNLIRPHINVMNTSALPKLADKASETAAAIPDAKPDEAADSAALVLYAELHELCLARDRYEAYFGTDSADQMRSPVLDSLISLASSLQTGSQQLHAIDSARHHKPVFSIDATRDQKVIFTLASRFASVNRIANFSGVILQAGRRVVTPIPGISKYHALAWVNPDFITIVQTTGPNRLDWIEQGVCDISELHLLRSIVFLESRKEVPPLTQLLEKAEPVHEIQEPGRVRGEDWTDNDLTPPPPVASDDESEGDPGPSISEVANDFAHEDNETLLAVLKNTRMKERAFPALHDDAFPVDRKTRPLTPLELKSHADDVEKACLAELESWLKNRTCEPCLASAYGAKTGLRPLPARWVIEFKEKIGQLIVKCRLCLKGFAESNQARLSTASPTASRLAHRLIYIFSVQNCWPLESLDVSTAFLQGWSFDELRAAGFERQPVAFKPPPGVWELLVKLDPKFTEMANNQDKWVLELHKSAYGLKDAPLLWNLRVISYILSLGLVQSKHDTCLLFLVERGAIVLMLSLHVDDTLVTGLQERITWFHSKMELKFGSVRREIGSFKHFGVDVVHNISQGECTITASQSEYIKALKPITVNRKRGDGRLVDSPASPAEITEYRSVVSGIAWVGVTHGGALAAASLLQNALPTPTIGDLLKVNAFLEQLTADYQPLVYKKLKEPLRFVEISDSSLGNVAKYSQGAHMIVLAHDSEDQICNEFNMLSFRSNKSKRVASSSMHAEALSATNGVEECLFLQTWWLELTNPNLSVWDLLHADSTQLLPIISCTDCNDLYEVLISPAFPLPSNRALTLYLSALREQKQIGRVKAWVWVDTRDCLANGMTKLEDDGTLPLAEITDALKRRYWEPAYAYRWNGQLIAPN